MSEDLMVVNREVRAKWVRLVERNSGKRKTRIWGVYTLEGDTELGEIRWHAPWRRYVFAPLFMTIFEPDCLGSISSFLAGQTAKRKEARRNERIIAAHGKIPSSWRPANPDSRPF